MDFTKYDQIQFRRKLLKFTGASITMRVNDDGPVIGFISMRAWKLREDIRIYSDETKQTEVMRISARKVLDIGGTYDIFDSQTNTLIATFQRKAWRSVFARGYWKLLDKQDAQVGYLQETSKGLALLRRYIELVPLVGDFVGLGMAFVSQTYSLVDGMPPGERPLGSIIHQKNPVVVKMTLRFSDGTDKKDRQVGVAATALLAIFDFLKDT